MRLLTQALRLALIGVATARTTVQATTSDQRISSGDGDETYDLFPSSTSREDLLEESLKILQVMQDDYFAPWLGTWPTAIDWTAAVMGTHVSGALSSISRNLDLLSDYEATTAAGAKENLVTLFFSQILSFYFGQDHFAIRNEAYDDILWVVLGWLETIQFINLHTTMTSPQTLQAMGEYLGSIGFEQWHGNIWIPAFAHRTRIFWNLAKMGWDWDLCGGGMTWNPRLEPYKNAITNELFIAASASMYLYFPGDWNHAPFFNGIDTTDSENLVRPSGQDVFKPHDNAFYLAAVDGYEWLATSGMKNDKGLYIDGFHISGYKDPKSTNKKCDVRNEQVYTYNQGVLLTGQLNLWKITGNYSYVEDGHRLVQSVIAATGWDVQKQRPVDHVPYADDKFDGNWRWKGKRLPRWHGLGRAGVIEEACDSKGACSQDAHTFKGIFFHHLTTFCSSALSRHDFMTVNSNDAIESQILSHQSSCKSYSSWLRHNTYAMLKTRNTGLIGTWWTAGLLGLEDEMPPEEDGTDMTLPNAVDYRNDGVPNDPIWRRDPTGIVNPPHIPDMPLPMAGTSGWFPRRSGNDVSRREDDDGNDNEDDHKHDDQEDFNETASSSSFSYKGDLNDRGRGRTVETQGSGLALLRAYWEVSSGAGKPRAAEPGYPEEL